MRLWHLVVIILAAAVVMTMARDTASRVALIVFVTGCGECAIGTASILLLFQTLGALGEARGFVAHVEAMAATTLVLGLATAAMTAFLWIGAWLVRAAVT